jgi:hypothetical protein
VKDKYLLTAEIAKKFVRRKEDLNEFKSIENEAAEILSKCKYEELSLNGLTSMSDAAAESISNYRNWLHLEKLTSLSDAAVERLSKHKGGILHLGLLTLSDAAAASLSKHVGTLYLNGLRSLSNAAAESLSKHEGDLYLNGLTSLSDAAAHSLSKHKYDLSLGGLTRLSDSPEHIALLRSLSRKNNTVDLGGLTNLSDAAAEILSKCKTSLFLFGLESLSDAASNSLAMNDLLFVNGSVEKQIDQARYKLVANPPRRKVLTVAVAKRYPTQLHGQSDCQDYWVIEDAAAELLSKGSLKKPFASLWLLGLRSLSDKVAESLSKFKGWIKLGDNLTEISDYAAECLLRFKSDKSNRLECSAEVEQLIKAARQRIAKKDRKPLWQNLVEARKAGATYLRTTWEGYGDDGCFKHQLFKDGQRINLKSDVEADVATIVAENGLMIDGEMNGSVGILEIDLVSGQAAFWDAQQPAEAQRFAEFLLRCEWAQADTLAANIKLLIDDDGCPVQEVKSVTTDPASAKKVLQPELKTLLYRIDYLEGGEELTEKIRQQCGTSVSLSVDVAARTIVFTGKGKNVSVKVSKNSLEIKRFKIDLGSSYGTKSQTAKKGKK